MEIKRIKTIQNIGTFANFTGGGSLGFEKLTLIYGLNTYGKTTLTDIFQSLKDNNQNILISRKTIPNQVSSQKIELSIKESSISGESDIKFENNSWSRNTLSKNLEVFGTEFIHKNLFTGLNIARENKENFTQFILGEDGVLKANQIAEKKKELGDKKRNIKNQIPHFVKGKAEPEIQSFLSLSIDGLIKEQLKQELITKEQERKIESDRLKEPQLILGLPALQKFSYSDIEINTSLEKINDALKSNYADIKEEVLKRIDEHITNSFSDTENAQNWIKKGREISDSDSDICSYCGQNLDNAKELMDAYDSYFDEEYSNYILNIEKTFNDNLVELEKSTFNNKAKIQDILSKILKYKEFHKEKAFQEKITELESKIDLVLEDKLNLAIREIIKSVKLKIEEKLKKPYMQVEEIDFINLSANIQSYTSVLDEIKAIIDELETSVTLFKKQYENTQEIQNKISSLGSLIHELNMKISRIEQNQECLEYQNINSQIQALDVEIPQLETELATEQNEYLDTYFTKINELFRKFGSNNFTLEKSTSNRGHNPIYFLEVKFHGEKISDEDFKTVFSESDRRALALAVFIAKIELKSSDEKAKTIVILDDPVTSFDDNRIINSIDIFKELLNSLGQIIVLTHYSNFLKTFFERTKDGSINTKFLKIEKALSSSKFSTESKENFTDTIYEKKFKKIIGFINGEHSESIQSDLRPFLESLYLPTVFAKSIQDAKIRDENISDLNDLINAIFTDTTVRSKFHSFRNNLNPEAHIFTSNNPEDIKNFAREMMDYLYSFRF